MLVTYVIGTIILTVTSISSISSTIAGPITGAMLISFAAGSMKSCVFAFGKDQFKETEEKQADSFFSILYFVINFSMAITSIVTPLLRGSIKCFGKDCYFLAFGVTTIAMSFADWFSPWR